MSLPGVLAALAAVVLIPPAAAAADPVGTPSRLVRVGPGSTESSQRQVVRTRDGVVYIASVEDDGWGAGKFARLHVYRSTTAGIPTAFAVQDPADEPHVDDPLRMSGGDARIDAAGTINVTYAVVDGNTLNVMYQTFDTAKEAWGTAERITSFDAGDDGLRGRVVSAIALDPSGTPLVVTAAANGVSAWSRTADSAWSRTALSGDYGLHPSLAFDLTGRAHLAWLSGPYDTPSIRSATRAPDGAWASPEVVSDRDVLSNETLDQSPSLAFDGSARPVVTFLDGAYHVRVGVREGSTWVDDGPTGVFSHSPALYERGSDRIVFLGHDADIHPAYLSLDASQDTWSSIGVFAPPAGTSGAYAYDGGASPRFDPLVDPDCTIADVAFFDEDSDLQGRSGAGKPDLLYAAVTLPRPPGGCAGPSGSEQPPAQSPPPVTDPPPADPPPAAPPPADPPPADPPPAAPPPPADPVTLLGQQALAPQTDHNPAGMAEAFQSMASASGALRSISVYLGPDSTAERVVAGVYADADGHPGALVVQGAAAATPGGWNAIDLPGTGVKAGEHYWIALLGTGGEITFRDEPDGGCSSETTPWGVDLAALPDSWSTGYVWDDCPVSAYAVGA
jgi:hypothetical protein